MSRVPGFKRHETDTGSPEVQIARLSARVAQLTVHLQEHRKDHACKRGLTAILSLRKRLLLYLKRQDRPRYNAVLQELHIRPPKTGRGSG